MPVFGLKGVIRIKGLLRVLVAGSKPKPTQIPELRTIGFRVQGLGLLNTTQTKRFPLLWV